MSGWNEWTEEKKYTVWSYYAELVPEGFNYSEWCDLMDSTHS